MYQVNTLLDKPVINQATGERLAKVDDVIFSQDMHAVVALLISGTGWFSEACVVRWGAVQSVGDVVVVRGEGQFPRLSNDPLIMELRELNHRISGTPLISTDANRVGTVTNVYLDDHGNVLGFEVDRGGLFSGRKFLPIAQVQTVGKDAVIASDTALVDVKEAEELGIRSVGE